MIITASDLATAVNYPLAVFQTLVRSFFGCGIVCGLEVKVDERGNVDGKPNYKICIGRGTAIDCNGFPLELCEPVKMNLAPDPCCELPKGPVCIAIRRITSDGAPRQDCGCSKDCGCKNGDQQHDDCGCK